MQRDSSDDEDDVVAGVGEEQDLDWRPNLPPNFDEYHEHFTSREGQLQLYSLESDPAHRHPPIVAVYMAARRETNNLKLATDIPTLVRTITGDVRLEASNLWYHNLTPETIEANHIDQPPQASIAEVTVVEIDHTYSHQYATDDEWLRAFKQARSEAQAQYTRRYGRISDGSHLHWHDLPLETRKRLTIDIVIRKIQCRVSVTYLNQRM